MFFNDKGQRNFSQNILFVPELHSNNSKQSSNQQRFFYIGCIQHSRDQQEDFELKTLELVTF